MNDQNHINQEGQEDLSGVAIIGMAGRFPKAANINEYWRNLVDSTDCITFYSNEELLDSGIKPEILENPEYVKAKGAVDNVDKFDASFFGINPREAEVTDPQHRMLMECAWEAMEHAGYDSEKYNGSIGIFAGKSMDYYLLLNVYPQIRKEISAGSLQAAIGNDKDSLTTTISYRLNLTGPGITIQTSSSTSLVSVCIACQSLLTYQCDIALAGGITAGPPIKSGYLYQEGNIWSPDGHCRAFDARAKGFVPGSGMGLVVLKRLEEAIADNDTIWAVIKGFAVNNDGSKKVSYSAPSVDSQTEVVTQALAVADVHPESIQYIEAHGTGTNMGDPIEIAALTRAFAAQTSKKQYCAIGSAKTNIGHLDNAAGVAGLIKTVMALKHKKIPASLHFETANPQIDFENSAFYVNTQLKQWEANIDGAPRRAGVTSLGMGGTNAHVIVEEAPTTSLLPNSRLWQLILLSAKTYSALENRTQDLWDYIKHHNENDINLADAVYTLQVGRRDFNFRRMLLVKNPGNAKLALETLSKEDMTDGICEVINRPVVFMFSGQGAQYVNMGRELYQNEPIFKENIDRCAELLIPIIDIDLRTLIYPDKFVNVDEIAKKLEQTQFTQPVLFIFEYSLAQLWMEWGIKPVAMIGHSIGEFTAACISGCISLEETLKLVVTRGRLMQNLEEGAMLSVVGIGEDEITKMLGNDLSLAAVNSPKHCVVSGTYEAIEKMEIRLNENNFFYKRLHTSHAFHSAIMETIMETFAKEVGKIKLRKPEIPFISGVTGTWITAEEVCNPKYWADQLRNTVCFSNGINQLLKEPSRILLEIGPGNSLSVLAKEHKKDASNNLNIIQTGIFSSIPQVKQDEPDMAFLIKTLGKLWLCGVSIDWKNYYKNENRQRIPLPTYPFERKRYWLEAAKDITTLKTDDFENSTPIEPISENIEISATKKFQPRPKLKYEYVTPTNDTESKLVEIWEDILGIQPIGIQDNFFDLGGHSLLATLFLSRLQEETGVRLELKTIFESPNIISIAKLMTERKKSSSDIKDIESLLSEIEGLSDDEVQMALVDEKPEDSQ